MQLNPEKVSAYGYATKMVSMGRLICLISFGKGMFKAWEDRDFFESVHIADRAVMWGEEIDLCPDALYMRLTGVSLEEYREISKLQATNA